MCRTGSRRGGISIENLSLTDYELLARRIVGLEKLILLEAPQSMIQKSEAMIEEISGKIGSPDEGTLRRAITSMLLNDLAYPFLNQNCGSCKRSPCPTPEKRDSPSTTESADIGECYEMDNAEYPESDFNQRFLKAIEAKYEVPRKAVLEELAELLTRFRPIPKFRLA
jgi:hypothetical protein